MLDRKIGGLPVLDAQDRLVGMLTESDVFRMLVKIST
jgi:CBS domain-containing protein